MEIDWKMVALFVLSFVFWGFLCFGTGMAIGVISKPPTYRIDQMVSESQSAPFTAGDEYVPPDPKKNTKSGGRK